MANELKPCPFCQCEPKLVRPMGDRLHNDKPPYYGPEKYRYSCSSISCCVMTNCHNTEDEARAQWNTRPAAPVEGLERYSTDELVRSVDAGYDPLPSEEGDFVSFDQAETIIAAERADYEEVLADKRRLTRLLDVAMHGEDGAAKQASLCDLIEPAKRLRADNAALTARVKEREQERDEAIRRGEDQWTGWVKEEVLRKALETQLAAAKKALEPFALISSEGVISTKSGHVTVTTCAEYFHEARAALEVKP